MLSITTLDELQTAVDHYAQYDEFLFDVETLPQNPAFSAHRGDPLRNRVVWLSIASYGRCDVVPFGHPNGDFVRYEFPLTLAGEKRVAEGKAPLKSSYSTDVRKATRIWTPPPQQLHWGPEVREILEPLFFSDRWKGGQNVKFDLKSIAKHFGGRVPPGPYFDTGITGFLLDVRNKGHLDLASIVEREVGYKLAKGVGKEIEAHSFTETEKYSWRDSKYAWLAWKELERQVEELGMSELWRLEMDVLEAVIEMEMTGAPVAVGRLKELDDYLRGRIEDVTANLYRLAGRPFNVDSNGELSEVLFTAKKDGGKVGLRPKILTDGGEKKKNAGEELTFRDYSVAEKALRVHEGNPFVDLVLEHADLKKAHGGFVVPYLGGEVVKTVNGKSKTEVRESMLVDGRLHATFKQDGAETGRFSSKNPNLQQVPVRSEDGKRIRALFSVEELHDDVVLVQADYSQIEPRILADLSMEPALLKVYLEGGDIYTALAEPFGLERGAGKVLFLSVAYGTGPQTLATAVRIPLKDAKDIIYSQFPKAFPRIESARKQVIRDVKRRKPAHVRTLMGRRRYLPDIFSTDNYRRARAERQAFNTYIQGSAADINKIGLVRCHRAVKPLGATLVATVHDEVLVLASRNNAEEVAVEVRGALESASLLKQVPLIAETKIVTNWADAK